MRALLSVSDKTGLVELGTELVKRGWTLISTGGTAGALEAVKVAVTRIESFTGVPEVMDGRVKTINPKIAGGILARRDNSKHMQALQEQLNSAPIDLVVVNLYPFEQTALRPEATIAHLIEDIDIGGPSLIRAAAKNFQFVYVITNPEDYPRLLQALDTGNVEEQLFFRFEMMRKAFGHTAMYDIVIEYAMKYGTSMVNGRLERITMPDFPEFLRWTKGRR